MSQLSVILTVVTPNGTLHECNMAEHSTSKEHTKSYRRPHFPIAHFVSSSNINVITVLTRVSETFG
jgi:hypothetical protein